MKAVAKCHRFLISVALKRAGDSCTPVASVVSPKKLRIAAVGVNTTTPLAPAVKNEQYARIYTNNTITTLLAANEKMVPPGAAFGDIKGYITAAANGIDIAALDASERRTNGSSNKNKRK